MQRRSNKRKNDGADRVGLQPAGQLTRMGFHLQGIGGAHKRIVRRGYRADRPFGCQVVQPVERKDDVPVLLEPGAIEIDRDVTALQITCRDGRRDGP